MSTEYFVGSMCIIEAFCVKRRIALVLPATCLRVVFKLCSGACHLHLNKEMMSAALLDFCHKSTLCPRAIHSMPYALSESAWLECRCIRSQESRGTCATNHGSHGEVALAIFQPIQEPFHHCTLLSEVSGGRLQPSQSQMSINDFQCP